MSDEELALNQMCKNWHKSAVPTGWLAI